MNTKNKFKELITLLLIVVGFLSMSVVYAHPGPVDRDGCHLDSQGRKHCH